MVLGASNWNGSSNSFISFKNNPLLKQQTMNLKKIDGGVWVKAENELPKETVFAKVKGWLNANEIKTCLLTPQQNGYYDVTGISFFYSVKSESIIEWLKPIKDVYVLTEDELKEITGDAMNYYCSSDDEIGLLPLNKQFIQSITK